MNLYQLSKECPSLQISIKLDDLNEFAENLITNTQKRLEQRIMDSKAQIHLSPRKTAETLGVDPSTLWRWQKMGYLVPIPVGGKKLYKMSDINKILEGK